MILKMSGMLVSAPLSGGAIAAIVISVVLVISAFVIYVLCVKKCPPDKIIVILGKVGKVDGKEVSSWCMHGGTIFVWPIIQTYEYLDLAPIPVSIDLKGVRARLKIRVDVSGVFTVGISTEQGIMQNAAERLLGLQHSEIEFLARDIIFGQLRLIIAETEIEELDADRDKFLETVCLNIEGELKKIGLRLINVNLDFKDDSGIL